MFHSRNALQFAAFFGLVACSSASQSDGKSGPSFGSGGSGLAGGSGSIAGAGQGLGGAQTGGNASTGGSSPLLSGGSGNSGTLNVGGTILVTGGQPPATGGASAVGGASTTGGQPTTAAGGTQPIGGTSTVGGRTATGGTTTAGGASTVGGASTTGGTGTVGIQACPAIPGAPASTTPLPTPAQLSYQRTEMTSFIHFSLATYDGTEQGNPADAPTIFNPTNLNATTVNTWIASLKAAGFRQTMLVTKHSIGFALWPSQYTSYSVKSSSWDGGKGDVVQLWSDAMHANGMRPALYLAPWDQKYTSSSATYQTYFQNQIAELFAYGPAYEIEFDGYNAPTTGNVNWKSVGQYLKQLQPNILIWAGPEIVKAGLTPDLQWIGNENGQASRTTSSLNTANCGGGSNWCPYECNISSHKPNWFWHPNQNPMALSDMQSVYFATVGMNCTLNFNIPPSQTGEFDPKDISLLQQFGTWYSSLYQTNLTKGQPATADSTWATAGFEASKAVDDDICTYWAAASGKTTGRLEVVPATPTTVKVISIREAIELGERVKQYHVEFKQNGTWTTGPTDKSGTPIKGTVIGQRQLWQVNSASVQAVALVIDSAKDVPAIAEFDVY